MDEFLTLDEWHQAAQAKLPQSIYDYYAGGALEERTLAAGTGVERYHLYPRVLADVTQPSTETTILGQTLSMPIMVAPVAMQQMAHPQGELATARAVATQGTAMMLSTLSNYSLEEVCQAAPGQVWFQLYVYRDRGLTAELVARAKAAGARALVVTVDAPILGRRLRDERNGFNMPEGLRLGNFTAEISHLPRSSGSGLAHYIGQQTDPGLTWKDIDWLRSLSEMPLIIKGISCGADARRALDHGASGIVVSNHGGRQLDGAPPPLLALPPVVETVDSRCLVMVDGGFRTGREMVTALAMGAQAVLVGRPILWGLAVAGEEGVGRVLSHLRRALCDALALCGCPRLKDLGPRLLRP